MHIYHIFLSTNPPLSVKADKILYIPETGQSKFYIGADLVGIAPKEAVVIRKEQ